MYIDEKESIEGEESGNEETSWCTVPPHPPPPPNKKREDISPNFFHISGFEKCCDDAPTPFGFYRWPLLMF